MGPRDWLPPTSTYEVDWRRGKQRSLLAENRCPGGRSAVFLAVLSLIFGGFALACAIAPWLPTTGAPRWVLTTVGVSAIGTGIDAMRRRRGRASLLITALGTLGIGTGVIATFAMVTTFLGATSFDFFHPAPQAIAQSVAPDLATGGQNIPQPPVPAPAAAAPSIGQMEASVGTLASLMKRGHQAGTRWPAFLQVSQDGVVTAPGIPGVALRLPAGTQLGYRTSTDGSAYAVRLSSTTDERRYVDYDTNSGVVSAGATGDTGS